MQNISISMSVATRKILFSPDVMVEEWSQHFCEQEVGLSQDVSDKRDFGAGVNSNYLVDSETLAYWLP